MFKKKIDLTADNIIKVLILFSIPIFLGDLFQSLYNSVDSIVIGNFVGKNALSAVSICGTIANLLVGFFNGLSVGASALFGRYYGAKDKENLNTALHTTLAFSLIFGVALSLLGIVFSPWLLNFVDVPTEIYSGALVYLRIYLAGMVFMSMYNICAGIIRATGDSKTPFKILVLSSCCNIVLDVVTVVFLKLSIVGVALATVVSQALSVALSLKVMIQERESYHLELREMKINGPMLKLVLLYGLPAGIQSSIQSISGMFVTKYLNTFGTAAISGVNVGMKIDRFVMLPSSSLGLALTTFVSQNLGAGKKDRIIEGIRKGIAISLFISIAIALPVYYFASAAVGCFTFEADVIEVGVTFLRIIIPFYGFMCLQTLYSGAVRGFGDSTVVMVLSILGYVVARQLWLYFALGYSHVIELLCYCYPVGWIVSAVTIMIYYYGKYRLNPKTKI